MIESLAEWEKDGLDRLAKKIWPAVLDDLAHEAPNIAPFAECGSLEIGWIFKQWIGAVVFPATATIACQRCAQDEAIRKITSTVRRHLAAHYLTIDELRIIQDAREDARV